MPTTFRSAKLSKMHGMSGVVDEEGGVDVGIHCASFWPLMQYLSQDIRRSMHTEGTCPETMNGVIGHYFHRNICMVSDSV